MDEDKLNNMSWQQLKDKVLDLSKVKKFVTKKGLTFCIVRTYSAGVFAGMFNRKNKTKLGTIFDAIRIFYWDGACSLSQLANDGTKKPDDCKFAQPVSEVDLREIIEVIPCSEYARVNIVGVKVWEK